MNTIKLIKDDLTLGKILSTILNMVIFTFLFFLFYYLGFGTSFINHQSMDGKLYILSNIIVFLSIFYIFHFSIAEWDTIINNKNYVYSLKSVGIFEISIYYGKFLSLLIHSFVTILISSTILILFAGISIRISFFFYFILFLLLSTILIIQIAAFIKYWTGNRNILQMNIVFAFSLLFLLSGFILPFYLFSGPLYTIIQYFPFAMVLEGSRTLLINHEFILTELLYVIIFTITFVVINHFLYKKELAQ